MSSSRVQEWMRQTPLITVSVIALCSALHLWQFVTGRPRLLTVTLCPRLVLYQGDAYRMVTGAFFHNGFMHLGLNCMSMAAIGSWLEKRVGSLTLCITIAWSVLFTSTIYIVIAWMGWWMFDSEGLMRQHSVGFSGVLFHLTVLECNLQQTSSSRSLFGIVQISNRVYPIALLFALQMFMPDLSFTGHLAGILAGYLHYFRYFDFLYPQDSYLREMESWSLLERIAQQPSFVRTPVTTTEHQYVPSLTAVLGSGCRAIARFGYHALETLCFILFGRGVTHAFSPNLRLPPLLGFSRQPDVVRDDDPDDSDDWSGLPNSNDSLPKVPLSEEV